MIRHWTALIEDTTAAVGDLFTQAREDVTAELARTGHRPNRPPHVGLDRGGLQVLIRVDVAEGRSEFERDRAFTDAVIGGADPVHAAERFGLTAEAARRVCARRKLPDAQRALAAAVKGVAV